MTIEAQKIDLASRLLAIDNQVALDLIEQAMQEVEVLPAEEWYVGESVEDLSVEAINNVVEWADAENEVWNEL